MKRRFERNNKCYNSNCLNWKLLLRLIDKYRENAERCLEADACFAGLVSVRAALETMLYVRFLLGLFDWRPTELREYEIRINDCIVSVPEKVKLYELIAEAHKQRLLDRTGFEAAERIREWGNKIHCAQVANGTKLPIVGRRNLQARLNDLEIVSEQLLRSL